MDHDTRFLLASEVTKHRDIEDARKVLAKARKASGEQSPDFLITDKLGAYRKAIPKEFLTSKQAHAKTDHVKLKNLREGTNNGSFSDDGHNGGVLGVQVERSSCRSETGLTLRLRRRT